MSIAFTAYPLGTGGKLTYNVVIRPKRVFSGVSELNLFLTINFNIPFSITSRQ